MLLRALSLAAGLTGAAGVSQFPEFSQQYMQRLGGAVDALAEVVAEFDADAASLDRHTQLSSDLEMMQGLGPFSRARHAARFTDAELAGRVWENYKPAMPVTFEGAIFAGVGFLGGLALFSGLIWLLSLPFSLFRRTSQP